MGVASWKTERGNVLGHDGKASGFASTIWYVIDRDVTVVVLTNDADNAIPGDIVEKA